MPYHSCLLLHNIHVCVCVCLDVTMETCHFQKNRCRTVPILELHTAQGVLTVKTDRGTADGNAAASSLWGAHGWR